ncbi:MAG: type II secretion system major pseudopilin GspG [Desulfurivibrionaceae bacterium]|nr:type II secretion system major pseudopilin GspG [Desulfobulbales bacterium]MDT8334069.1 type II secretion system major pseudopilin GspG [Desulfurivibrionaceae bacterium]
MTKKIKQTGRQAMARRFAQGGFTLIEIMVVVVILSILAAFVVPKIMDRPDQARIVKVEQDIRAIEGSLKLYKLDNYVYPSTDQGLEALVKRPQDDPEPKNWKEGGYLDRLPLDPWGNEYLYLNPGLHGSIDIFSMGADGQPGGEGVNADIGNWRDDN